MEKRPICVNHGCNFPVTSSGVRWRPFCARCHKSNYGAKTLAEGVTPFRTGKCTNDGILGFKCSVNYRKAPWAIGMTEIDHIDGNHLNNTVDNLMELCPMCHKMKTKLAGDSKVQYKYQYKQ